MTRLMTLQAQTFIAEATCSICDNTGANLIFVGPDRLMHLPGSFQLVRCQSCGTFYQWPRPRWSELEAYYHEGYDSYVPAWQDEKSIFRRMTRRFYAAKMRWFVEQFHVSGSLLDVGCGTGVFLEEMQASQRWQLYGIEPTKIAASYVQERFNIPVINDQIENVRLAENFFDVITMWNVFEHLENPKLAMRSLYQALKPGGILVIAVPNYESLSRWLFGKYWCGWDLPRHLFVLPRSTLLWMLEKIGFRPITSKCFIGTRAILKHSLDFLSQDLTGYRRLLMLKGQKFLFSPVGVALFYPLQLIIEKFGLASIITWSFQKG